MSKTENGRIIVSGPLNFVTIEKLIDLSLVNNDEIIETFDLGGVSHFDYIAIQKLKQLLSDDEDINPKRVILPLHCPQSFKNYISSENVVFENNEDLSQN